MDLNFAKTQTLLYFFECLIREGEPQKISYLATLFGDKDFTNDMRAVVKSSLSGLKKLLSDHPCLFKIVDGEFVYLHSTETTANVIDKRDCNEDTKEYFKHKLLSYGIGYEVPIKSLHGHRSQAPHGIRHTSGLTIEQFHQFLSKYPETFRIVDKNVSLLGYDHLKPHRSTLNDGLPNVICQNAVVAVLDPAAKVKSQNLCASNCPTIYEIANVFSPVQLCAGGIIGSEFQIRKNSQVISTVAESLVVTSKILECVANTGAQAVVSFNSKGSRSGTNTMMTLLVIGTPSGDTFLFDVLTCPQIMIDGGVKELLESDRIVKVIHSCRYKSRNLYEQFKIILKCVFDTQIANAVLHYQKDGTDVSKAKELSLHQMVQLYCPFNSVSKPIAKNQWSARRRPFTDEMIVYAAREILVLLQLYGCMALLISDQNKALLSQLCTEEILKWILPEEVEVQQMKRNIRPDAVASKDSQKETPTSSKKSNLRSLDSDSRGGVTQLESTLPRCCDCYVDKENQTLSTGDIVMLSKTYDKMELI